MESLLRLWGMVSGSLFMNLLKFRMMGGLDAGLIWKKGWS